MNISSIPIRNKYIHIAYISIIASLLLWGTVGPTLLQAAAQEADEAQLELLCTHYGEGVVINRGGRTESISFREWLAIEHSDLVDLFSDVGCPGISAAVAGGEVYGIGTTTLTGIDRVIEEISDCGDDDPDTRRTHWTQNIASTWTGIIDGESSTFLERFISDVCVANQLPDGRGFGRLLDIVTFEEVTIAGRTGGAVLEMAGHFEFSPVATDNQIRLLCGTGELEGIHGVGYFIRSGGVPRSYALTVHFDDHGQGYDHLCAGL